MLKKWLVYFLIGVLLVTVSGNRVVHAQTSPAQGQLCRNLPAPVPLTIPFNPSTDSSTFRPATLQQSNSPCQDSQAVVGRDDRVRLTSQQFPWSTVGRIDVISDGREFPQCTGTLIGRDMVLTNSHCIFREGQLISETNLVFKPNLIKESADAPGYNTNDRATVVSYQYGWASIFNPFAPENQALSSPVDWALLKLNKPLGEKYGYLGWRSLNLNDPQILAALKGQVRLAGYSGDFPREFLSSERGGDIAGVHVGCTIEGLYAEGGLIHDCDTMAGSSGSAMIAPFQDADGINYYVIGLNNAEIGRPWLSARESCETINRQSGNLQTVPEGCANLGVQVSRWAAQAAAMRQ